MHDAVLKFVSIFLVVCVLSVGGFAQAQSVEHAGHHAHHSAATHAASLCSWLCAAGQLAEGSAAPPLAVATHASPAIQPVHAAFDLYPISSSTSRGPPLLVVSR